jgi:methylase of polypeptide subunit release factors
MIRKTLFPRPTELAHEWLKKIIVAGDHVIDATLGNGHDALFLAQCVGATGRVHGFDVQEQAIEVATAQMLQHGIAEEVYQWHLLSHEKMAEVIDDPVKAVMFNLGYLPGADHGVMTVTESTLAALEAASRLVIEGGLMTIVCYPGHVGGDCETESVKSWAMQQGEQWHVVHFAKWATKQAAPELIAMQKKEVSA